MLNIHNNSCTNAIGEFIKKNQEKFRPLTKDEETALIQKYKDDSTTMGKLLVQHNIRLVFNLAKKYAPTSVDFDEMIGRGFEGLCIAAEKFDPSRNIRFCTYAYAWIFKYIQKEYSDDDVNTSKLGIPLNKNVMGDDGKATTFENLVNNYLDPSSNYTESFLSTQKVVESNELSNLYSNLLNYVETSSSFDDLDKIIFQRNLIDKDSIKTISADLNIQYTQANQKKKDLLLKLKALLGEKYGINSMEDI